MKCYEYDSRLMVQSVHVVSKNFILSGMGYDESQYSLPRWMDLSISRQGMFDDTYHYIPSQGWMFLPLVAVPTNLFISGCVAGVE